jgi:hypothetical protein
MLRAEVGLDLILLVAVVELLLDHDEEMLTDENVGVELMVRVRVLQAICDLVEVTGTEKLIEGECTSAARNNVHDTVLHLVAHGDSDLTNQHRVAGLRRLVVASRPLSRIGARLDRTDAREIRGDDRHLLLLLEVVE